MDTQANKASSQPDRQMDKKKVFLLSGGHLSCDINTGALPAVIPYLQEFYGLTYQATGNIMFAQSLISALTQPLFGLLSDKFTKPWLAPLGVLLAGLGLTLTGLCSNYYAMLAAVGVCGVGSSLFHPTAARLANQVAGTHKGMALSIFSIGGNGGFVIGPLIAAALLASFGLGGTLFFGILGVITALSLVFGIMHMSMPQKAAQGKSEGTAARPNNWKQFNRLTARIGKYDFDTEKFQTFDGDFAALHKCCRLLFHNLFLVDMIHRPLLWADWEFYRKYRIYRNVPLFSNPRSGVRD